VRSCRGDAITSGRTCAELMRLHARSRFCNSRCNTDNLTRQRPGRCSARQAAHARLRGARHQGPSLAVACVNRDLLRLDIACLGSCEGAMRRQVRGVAEWATEGAAWTHDLRRRRAVAWLGGVAPVARFCCCSCVWQRPALPAAAAGCARACAASAVPLRRDGMLVAPASESWCVCTSLRARRAATLLRWSQLNVSQHARPTSAAVAFPAQQHEDSSLWLRCCLRAVCADVLTRSWLRQCFMLAAPASPLTARVVVLGVECPVWLVYCSIERNRAQTGASSAGRGERGQAGESGGPHALAPP
jgi:hypothetical protein